MIGGNATQGKCDYHWTGGKDTSLRTLLVGGSADNGSGAGLGGFCSVNGVSGAWADVGFRSVGSKKAALYISKQFGKLLFEISYGGINCNWKWIA